MAAWVFGFSSLSAPPQGPPEAPRLNHVLMVNLPCDGLVLLLPPVVCFGFGRRDVADGLQQPAEAEERYYAMLEEPAMAA